MAKIIIGAEYADEFNGICNLYNGGFLSGDIHIKGAGGNVIRTETHTFIFSENEHGVNGSGGMENSLQFTGEGATWFAPLRGADFDSGNADWKQLIMDVASDYHKHYSLIEFKQQLSGRDIAAEARLRDRFMDGFVRRVFPEGNSITASDLRYAERENVYAVSMRLEINGGAESAPVLGKVYFRETPDGELKPILSAEAGNIDGFISSAVPSEETQDGEEIIDVGLVGHTFTALDRVFSGGQFAKFVLFGEKYKRAIAEMLSLLATSEVKTLECTNVKILGISHVEWEKSVYKLLFRGREALKLTLGINGSVSLECVNCDGETLIDGNVIKFKGKVPEGCASVINTSLDNFGLIASDIEAIREKSAFADHLFTVACPENPRNRECFKTVCRNQTVEVEVNGKTVKKCRGCRYPEIIFSDIFHYGAQGAYTPSLNFATDKLALTQEKTAKCACCGREFTETALKRGGVCAFCAGTAGSDEDRALYRKYSGFLSIPTRLFHLFSHKYCREDDNILLFELGGDKFVFDKLDIRDGGFVKKPVKYRGRTAKRRS